MNKFFTLLISLLFGSQLFATHIKGGEVFYDHIQGNLYKISLVLYGEFSGINLPTSDNLTVTGHQTLTSIPVNLVGSGPALMPISCSTTMRVGLYESQPINLGAIPSTGLVFSYNSCCRPTVISNLSSPSAQSYYIEALMLPLPGQTYSSSSARFFRPADMSGSSGDMNHFSTVAYDPDPEDSVNVVFGPAKGLSGFLPTVLTYANGYSYDDPFGVGANNTFLDENTGLLSADSISTGAFAIVQRVRSYRNGVLVSAAKRDDAIYSFNDGDDFPTTSISSITSSGLVSQTNNTIHVEMNSTDSLSFLIDGLLIGDSISITGHGNPIFSNAALGGNCNGPNCAKLIATNGSFTNYQSSQAKFSFKPDASLFPAGASVIYLNFSFEVWDHDSCSYKRPVSYALSVRLTKVSSISANSNLSICQGGMVQAQILGDTTNLSWSPASGVSDTTSASPYLFPTATTTYTVTNLNDGSAIQITVNVDSITAPVLGANGTVAYVPNYSSNYDGVVWYYSGVAIAQNVDSIVTPVTGDYFAIVTKGACTAFSDTVSVTGSGTVLGFNPNNGSVVLAQGNGLYEMTFQLNDYSNNLTNLSVAINDSGFFKTNAQPEFNLYDDQQQLIASGMLNSLGNGLWQATGINATLLANTPYQLNILTHSGKVALYAPAAFPFTELAGVLTVNSAGYNENGSTKTDAYPFVVFGLQSNIGIVEAGNSVSIYPNPMQHVLVIDAVGKGEFSLMDATGRVVLTSTINNTTEIQVNDLSRGIYFYELVVNGKKSTGKIVK